MTSGLLQNGMIIWLLVAVAGFGALMGAYLYHKKKTKYEFAIQRRSRLLSPAEKKFFECLDSSLSEDYHIFTKVAMMDVIESIPTANVFESKQNKKKLAGECFDFVLCKKQDLSVFGIVELENFEKRSGHREKASREKLINAVCKAAHLRLFYFDVRQDYQGIDIRRLITGRSAKPSEPEINGASRSQFTIDNSSYAAFAKQRSCPQCNGEVVTKVAVKGKRIGEKFLMCRKYPYCDYRVAMNDKHVMEKMQRSSAHDKKVSQKPGFSDWSAG